MLLSPPASMQRVKVATTNNCSRGLYMSTINMAGTLIVITTCQSSSCCAVCAEAEWERFLTTFKLLDGCFGRGLLQAFEALLTLELTVQHGIKEGTSDFHKSLHLYRAVAGVSLLVCSAFYILGGLLCFGRTRKGRHIVLHTPSA